jgi:type VI secretion system protein ImpL
MKKAIWIGVLIFVIYFALIVGIAYLAHLSGMRFILFLVIMGLVGLIALVIALVYKSKHMGPAIPEANAAEAAGLDGLVKAANTKLKASPGGAKSLAALPLIYVIGDENSAKTQTILQSGLDPELLAGEVYRDNMVAPTRLANFWLTASSAVVVEAGGALIREPALWQRLVSLTQPNKMGAALSKGGLQPTRAAILCVSIERITGQSVETVRVLGKTLNERLRVLSQTLGISLPVYVLFTKLDTIPSFADYAGNLTQDEVNLPLGALLGRVEATSGLYAEKATSQTAGRFDELTYSLSEFRLEVLSRGGTPDKLAKAYEFPRELRKLRGSIVDLLIEIGRPSQLGVNPFLRGFYFSGMRAQLVEDGPQQVAAAAVPPPVADAGATRIFSFSGAQTPAAPVPQRSGSRRVPQWVFLPHLFPRIVLADRTALDTSRASTKVNVVKRILVGSVAACFLVYLILLSVSYFNNSGLENRLKAAAALPTQSVSKGDAASVGDLQNLEQLRQVFTQIAGYRKDGAPLSYRWGLYDGDRMYKTACAAYGNHFRTLLLTPTQTNILARMGALPAAPAPTDEYIATYRPLRAYLVTTSNPEKASPDLAGALQDAWVGNRQLPSQATDLSLAQFQTYAETLPTPGSCMATLGGTPRMPVVLQARAYLSHFQGIEQVYISMKAAADKRFASIRFNDKFPGSVHYVVDNYEVEGAFTKGGYTFMEDAIVHPQPYTSGEEWVLGPQTGPVPDPATVTAQLAPRYQNDFLNTWRTYLKTAHVVPVSSFADAKDKLHQLDSPSSALLELFQVISQNTAVKDPAFSTPFQAPQFVVAPNSVALPVATPYMQGLQGLEGAIGSMLLAPGAETDPAAAGPVIAAATATETAVGGIRGGFSPPDPIGGMDTTSERLLLAPIKSVEDLAKAAPKAAAEAAAGGGAKAFCAQLAPVLNKFPFNPSSQTDASMDEIGAIFKPEKGALAVYAGTLSKVVTLQGNTYAAAPGSTVEINPAFLHFLNSAQQVSAAFFPPGGGPLQINFTLTQESTPNLPPASLDVDGNTLTGANQTKQFNWKSSPSSNVVLNASGRTNPSSGPLSVFHFAYSAKTPGPNKLEFIFQVNGQTARSPSGVPLDYTFLCSTRTSCAPSFAVRQR